MAADASLVTLTGLGWMGRGVDFILPVDELLLSLAGALLAADVVLLEP